MSSILSGIEKPLIRAVFVPGNSSFLKFPKVKRERFPDQGLRFMSDMLPVALTTTAIPCRIPLGTHFV